jgi:hypothetical protein
MVKLEETEQKMKTFRKVSPKFSRIGKKTVTIILRFKENG